MATDKQVDSGAASGYGPCDITATCAARTPHGPAGLGRFLFIKDSEPL